MKKLFSGNKRLADICLIGLFLLAAAVLYLLLVYNKGSGAYAVVRVNGEEQARYSLSENGRYLLNGGSNILIIEDGRAWLEDANCPDKLCVKQGVIQYDGQCITCLPNKLTVTLVGAEEGIELVS